jgi:Arc/MetJ family transcription regulator
MRTTLALDDDLVAKAQALTGLKEKASLIREALKALIERESARRLARLGGSEPGLERPQRHRPAAPTLKDLLLANAAGGELKVPPLGGRRRRAPRSAV